MDETMHEIIQLPPDPWSGLEAGTMITMIRFLIHFWLIQEFICCLEGTVWIDAESTFLQAGI